eukprot:s406_g2.t1
MGKFLMATVACEYTKVEGHAVRIQIPAIQLSAPPPGLSLRLRSSVPSDAEFVLNCALNSKPVHIVARGQFPGHLCRPCAASPGNSFEVRPNMPKQLLRQFLLFHSMSIMLAAGEPERERERERVSSWSGW